MEKSQSSDRKRALLLPLLINTSLGRRKEIRGAECHWASQYVYQERIKLLNHQRTHSFWNFNRKSALNILKGSSKIAIFSILFLAISSHTMKSQYLWETKFLGSVELLCLNSSGWISTTAKEYFVSELTLSRWRKQERSTEATVQPSRQVIC